jgi:hypothetical protein
VKRFLAVANFSKHQHYKDRNPPWIKFHTSTLSNYAIASLPDAAQGQLFKLWLVASRHDNRIPYDLKFIKREIRANGRLYIRELIASGLLELCEQDASTALAPRARSRESEVETETETDPTAAPADIVRTPGEIAFLATVPPDKRIIWEHILNGWRVGLGTPRMKPFSDDDISAGLLEYLAKTTTPDFSPRHVCTFPEQIRERREESEPRRIRGPQHIIAPVSDFMDGAEEDFRHAL